MIACWARGAAAGTSTAQHSTAQHLLGSRRTWPALTALTDVEVSGARLQVLTADMGATVHGTRYVTRDA